MILGDLGAEILKIERPLVGDETRKWGPPFFQGTKESTYFASVNRNKKSLCIDIKKGKDVIYDLAKKSDVFIENYVPGKLAEMGLDYKSLSEAAPGLIYCSITGYGSEGPYATRPGYDVIAASLGGLINITGPKDGEPCKVGVAVTDMATGLYAHGAIMAALLQRFKTNRGQWIQCNLLSTQVASLVNIASNYLNAGKEASRWGTAHESIVPYEAFPTKDGFISVGAGSDVQFLALLKMMNLTNLEKDPKFRTNIDRVKHRVELINILRDNFKTKTSDDWSEIFRDAPFPNGRINTIGQVFDDPHIKHIKLVKEMIQPSIGKDIPTMRLCLRKPKSSKKVQWTQGTVDNEHMNKKKSKCCCIYEKPKEFGESSSEDSDDECEHCHGHRDIHHKNNSNGNEAPQGAIPSQPEPIATGSA
ncbi:succinate--hydroxymethylglutarate CoA-transferase isoform X1 [Neodiprion pinetum]|nr:succinate--hydroxymethylglutarate CoA-transferase-like isoform X1 [Neodiprion pinetum]